MPNNRRKPSKKQKPKRRKIHPIETQDVWGNFVVCTATQWRGHIIEDEGRIELLGREQEVERTISDPDQVRPSTKTGLAYAFEMATTTDVLRAIVYYPEGKNPRSGRTDGTVATVYLDDPVYTSQVGAPIYQKNPGSPTTLKPLGGKEEK